MLPQPVLCPFDGTREAWRGLLQRIYDLAVSIPLFNLSNPVLERHR